MAYAFPLTTGQFWAILPIRDLVFDLSENVEISGETEAGEVLTASRGTRLWYGEVTLDDMSLDEAAEVAAMLSLLRGNGASFMAFDAGRPGPRHDITGGLLGASAPALHTVNANNRDIRLTGLPANYRLSRHDYLAFSYGANPTRHALHRIAAPAQAAGNGTTPLFEVVPPLRPGWAQNTPVTLLRGACKCRIVPGATQPGVRRGAQVVGASFQFIQTLR